MSRHAQNVAPPFAGFPQSRQNQISVVVVTVQKKAVISIHPVFPRQKPDILRFDYQNLAAVGAFEYLPLPHLDISASLLRAKWLLGESIRYLTPDPVIDILDTYIYRLGLTQGQYEVSTAVGLLKGVVGVVLVLITHGVSKKLTGTGVW